MRGPGGGGRGPGGGLFGRGGNTGRWDVGLFHTIKLQDEILIRPGVPTLDLLNGSATGSSGGTSRHEVELNGGYFFRGIGVRLSSKWRSATDVVADPTTLHFSPQMTVNARVFFDLNQLGDFTTRNPIFRNTRIRFAVDNLFNDRQEVRDQNGITPIRYQPAYMDAAGRTVSIEIRKQF
jgi:outer membrane receptor protein involved in Fe transport